MLKNKNKRKVKFTMPKNEGKKFEEDFKKSCDNTDGVFFYRLKDGSASWGGNDLTRFQAKNDFDNFIYSIYGLCLLELKSTLGKSLPLGNYYPKTKINFFKK